MSERAAPELLPLALARIAFGVVFLLRTTPILAPLELGFLTHAYPLLGWPDGSMRFPMLGLELPDALVAALCIARTISAVAFCAGIKTRVSALVAGVCGYLVLAQDAFGYFNHLHLLYLGTILFGLGDAGARLALFPDPARSPASSLRLMQLFVASIYGWAAIAKLRVDWLDGRALETFYELRALRGPIADAIATTDGGWMAIAVTVPLLEAALSVCLLVRKTSLFAMAAAMLFHVGLELVARVDSIGWQMLALLLVFIPRSAPREPATPRATDRTSRP